MKDPDGCLLWLQYIYKPAKQQTGSENRKPPRGMIRENDTSLPVLTGADSAIIPYRQGNRLRRKKDGISKKQTEPGFVPVCFILRNRQRKKPPEIFGY
jgi:hypothetical protein